METKKILDTGSLSISDLRLRFKEWEADADIEEIEAIEESKWWAGCAQFEFEGYNYVVNCEGGYEGGWPVIDSWSFDESGEIESAEEIDPTPYEPDTYPNMGTWNNPKVTNRNPEGI
tara:strand:- start:985 stop:1335 length:351 start_codon:yes stop_codon:yes gene_type:complete